MQFVLSLTDAAKRLLVGRPVHSERLAETLLPKRIALPVFASDALSSVAYAPDEIFLTLALAGVAAFTASAWIGLAVAFVMLIVVASYRQNVHAYPSGGGDYEVATVNLGVRAGLTVASALLVDYVLTVAVSVSSGAQYAAAAIPWLRGHEALFAVGRRRDPHDDEPARRAGVGDALRRPDLPLHGRDPRDGGHRRLRALFGELPQVESAGLRSRPRARSTARASPDSPGRSCCCGHSARGARR